jgi:hypothetical protein
VRKLRKLRHQKDPKALRSPIRDPRLGRMKGILSNMQIWSLDASVNRFGCDLSVSLINAWSSCSVKMH